MNSSPGTLSSLQGSASTMIYYGSPTMREVDDVVMDVVVAYIRCNAYKQCPKTRGPITQFARTSDTKENHTRKSVDESAGRGWLIIVFGPGRAKMD